MQLTFMQALMGAAGGINKVTAICFSPNDKRLAVCLQDRIVYLYDENGERREKFSTKPADKAQKEYTVRAMAFSPDSTRLAVAQSDNIVFVYKLGLKWGDKKSICNKFIQTSPITDLVWPASRGNEVVYGLAEGKVKVGVIRTNKPATLYSTESFVVAVAANPDGTGVVSAHLDGSIYRFLFVEGGAAAKIAHHPCVPYALGWAAHIVVAGNDSQVIFYDSDGGQERTFDYSNDPKCREFTKAVVNPTGETVMLGNFDSLYVYSLNKGTESWEEVGVKQVPNLYSVTALGWKGDGGRVAVGSVCGQLDIYDACLRRSRYKGKYEFIYVSLSQVIVKRLSNGSRIVLKSLYGFEIVKINIFQDRYVVANTTQTLLLGDLETFKLSEVQWFKNGGGGEKFVFDNPSVCMVYHAGELSLIEYGSNEPLGSVRTEYISGHLLSVRINERAVGGDGAAPDTEEDSKQIAYLLDTQTVALKDLVTQTSATINHDSKIDWIELNTRGNLLLFRDKRRHLHLYDVDQQIRHTLLNFCTYVQWVPDSDVVVAQNRSNLCVWYNIHAPDQVTVHQIKGDVEEIERVDGRTEVIVDEGISAASYLLDEALIQFGTALDDRRYSKAVEILETLELSPEAEGMWRQLSDHAMAQNQLVVAERCAAALGDVSRARFLHDLNEKMAEEDIDVNHWMVRSRLALLNKDLRQAEDILLAQGRADEAIDMYRTLHQFDEAIAVAESQRHADAARMRESYFQHLLDTRQEERAGLLKEREGDVDRAISLYLKGGVPARAAKLIKTKRLLADRSASNMQMLERVANALATAGLYDRAGEFHEEMDQLQKALDSYIKGHAYRQAVDLSRRHFPSQVTDLEEAWGDWLVANKQVDMAINHFIEAQCATKAIEAALKSRQWGKAAQFAENLEPEAARPYFKRIAKHYEDARQFDEAEKYYVAAQATKTAVEMYTKNSMWDRAHKLATSYMSDREVGMLYISQAQRMEAAGKLREAEQLFLKVNEADLAINMYKKQRKYDAMVRLVAKYRKELLKETHQFLAQHLESEANLKDAEHHYCEAGEWLSAVNMYRSNDMWEDAIRVAKLHGGMSASKRVAFAWALALGGEAGAKLLTKLGLIEPAIDYAIETGGFDHAFELARSSLQRKLPEIHLKHALFLEDEEKYAEAEDEFINANKPREAIDMYVHTQDWANALRVAETYDPAAVADVCVAQARAAAERRDFARAQELYLSASKPEFALTMFQEANMWQEALELAQKHLPHKLAEVNMAYQSAQASQGQGGSKADFLSQGRVWEEQRKWTRAIDAYLNARPGLLPPDELEQVWEAAVRVARQECRNRYAEVVREVTSRLAEIGRHGAAAETLREAQDLDGAVAVALQGQCWDQARELAQGQPSLEDKVERVYQSHLVSANNTDGLLELGHTNAALDVLARGKEWDRLWDMAAKEHVGPTVLAKYAALRANQLLDEDDADSHDPHPKASSAAAASAAASVTGWTTAGTSRLDDAVAALHKYGASTSTAPAGLPTSMLSRLTKALLSRPRSLAEKLEDRHTVSLQCLRDVLRLAAQEAAENSDRLRAKELQPLLLATHYSHLLQTSRGEPDLKELAPKVAISLLAFNDVIPADKLFYDAGIACKDQGHANLAFVLLNRYVDLIEAIEVGDPTIVDNSDLQEATNVPYAESLPSKQHLTTEEEREEVREWVLTVCMDTAVDAALPSVENARGTIYEGMFSSERKKCIVTGFPVYDELVINDVPANKRDWNLFVSKTKQCPWTGKIENPQW